MKVKDDNGYAAVVYNPQDFFELEDHVDESNQHNRNFFKVYWDSGSFPSTENSCGNGVCKALSGGGCLCDTKISINTVFTSMPTSAEHVLSSLYIGVSTIKTMNEFSHSFLYNLVFLFCVRKIQSVDPSIHDPDMYNTITDDLTGITVHKSRGKFNEETIFEVTDMFGRRKFLKNVHETVHMIYAGGGESGMSFRNAPTFMSLISTEVSARDAHYETEATLENYFYQESTAPFIAIRLIQRLVSSNPSPRYVKEVATAFYTGYYVVGEYTYGSGKYGDLAASIAAVILDREARNALLDKDPSHGLLREPILKVIGLMRSMKFENVVVNSLVKMWNIEQAIGQMAHEFPTVFSFFLPDYDPDGRIGQASLVAPEAIVLDTPKIVSRNTMMALGS